MMYPRDLDSIVLKAMQIDPEDRYRSVAALEADVRRWLDGRPVEAGNAGLPRRAAVERPCERPGVPDARSSDGSSATDRSDHRFRPPALARRPPSSARPATTVRAPCVSSSAKVPLSPPGTTAIDHITDLLCYAGGIVVHANHLTPGDVDLLAVNQHNVAFW